MWSSLCLALALSFLGADPVAVPFTTHSGHFERNDSGLKGEVSSLVVETAAEFEQRFGVAAVMRQKQNFVKPELFAKRRVCAVIHRGKEPWGYEVKSVTQVGDVVEVRYQATKQASSGTATFASPLIVSFDRTSARQLRLIENNKELATLDLKTPASAQP
ncbi:MAG: hypothetical protein ACKOJF_19315 [Planctomycetaceae bacterium]